MAPTRALLRVAALIASLILTANRAQAQEALQYALSAPGATPTPQGLVESQPATFVLGDAHLNFSPSLGLDWDDNINLAHNRPEDDFVVRPALSLEASYPITQRNVLRLALTLGYDKYLKHDELSRLRIASGSALSFDVSTGAFLFNLHDRFSYTQDSATEAAVANTGLYGTWQNLAGLSGRWDSKDLTVNLLYDHLNFGSTASAFNSTDHTSELVVARSGFKFAPGLVVGLEGTDSITSYSEKLLNDNDNYSAGVYGEWKPGNFFTAAPRAGYTANLFQQTSRVISARNQSAWYADVTVSHQATAAMSYSFSAGHELRLGVQSDAIEDTYLRFAATWNVIRNVNLQTSAFYERGSESGSVLPGLNRETFNWYGGGVNLSYLLAKRLTVSLDYRLTLRDSDFASRSYAQNVIGLLLAYRP